MAKSSNQIDISLGGRLREKRTSTGWSQEQLAEKLQIDPKDIYAYEAGAKRITVDSLLRLSKILGVKPVYFFGFDDNSLPVDRDKARLTLPDQGLRLHRAFIGVKDPALREAIVSLVVETGEKRDGFVAQSAAIGCATSQSGESEFLGEFLRFRRLNSELLTKRLQSRQEALSGIEKPCIAHGAADSARPADELRIAADGF